ncbi:MAG: DNA-directed RNA polymerase subunit omega [Synergistetes bacterium]|nr:DNA-directed RNA polymerase subunit omega [Synergistota bacterium]
MKKRNISTRYLLTMIIAKRARAIGSDPSRKVLSVEPLKPISIALKELDRGLIEWELPSKAFSKERI